MMGFLVSYIKELISAMPYIIIVSLIASHIFERLKIGRGLYIDTLAVSYVLSLIYVWYFLSGEGMMEIALLPGKTWYKACRYGMLNTDGMYIQFVLNAIMLMPAGFLCEVYGKKKYYLIALAAMIVSEMVQGMCGRAFDADDLLAYALGMAMGGILYRMRMWKGLLPKNKVREALFSLGIMFFFALPFIFEGMRNYGYSYIEAPVFSNMVVHDDIDLPDSMPVYRRQPVDIEAMIKELSEITGIIGEIVQGNGVAIYSKANTRLVVNEDGTWLAEWGYRQGTMENLTIDEIVEQIRSDLGRYGYEIYDLRVTDDAEEMYCAVEATVSTLNDLRWQKGKVIVEMYTNGMMKCIQSDVAVYERIGMADVYSLNEALARYRQYPNRWQKECFEVSEIEVVYQTNATRNEMMGNYLIPCLVFKGKIDDFKYTESISLIDYGLW